MVLALLPIFLAVSCVLSRSEVAKALPDTHSLMSVPDLEAAMYTDLSGQACVRLLSATEEHGCSNPYREPISAPVERVGSVASAQLAGKRVILVPSTEFIPLLQRTLDDSKFVKQVAGVLVEFDYEDGNGTHALSAFSPADPFPQASLSPYVRGNPAAPEASYVWNVGGSGLARRRWPFPVFVLSADSTAAMRERAALNSARKFQHPLHAAELSAVMLTTKLEIRNSSACLAASACLPLGGFSVVSAFPPLPAPADASAGPMRPIILAVAAMDASSFFRDLATGADSPFSGVIALLAAADALFSFVPRPMDLPKRIVFAVFTGEQWGYLGSRRFLHELRTGGKSVAGLDPKLVEAVIEVGSVGRAVITKGVRQFYAHPAPNSGGEKLFSLLSDMAGPSASVLRASPSNPGIPPTSLTSFVWNNSSMPGVVLTEYDSHFLNRYYMSRYDDTQNVAVDSIAAAADTIARALITAAGGGALPSPSPVNTSLIQELVNCLLKTEPGMFCSLAKEFLTSTQAAASHYAGVFQSDPRSAPYEYSLDITAQFLWNFLASRTNTQALQREVTDPGSPRSASLVPGPGRNYSRCSGECMGQGEVCVALREREKGVCIVSTTRYVPALSPRLYMDDKGWHVRPLKDGEEGTLDALDPLWTESFWNTLNMRVFVQDSPTREMHILVGGILATSATAVVIHATRLYFEKALKRA